MLQKTCIEFSQVINKVLVKKTKVKKEKMLGLKRMNAFTPAQGIIFAKLANNEPVSPKSMAILNTVIVPN